MGKQLGPCRYTSPMRIFLYGISSFSYWLTAECRPNAHCGVGVSALKSCVPHRKTVEYLEKLFPSIPQPYHVTVPVSSKSSVPQAIAHLSRFAFAERPFVRIENGVFASCPELCFVQLALTLPFHELVKAGDALCGSFYIDPTADNGLGSRVPLTSRKRIEAFVRRNVGLRGTKQARRALRSVVDNAASPPEAFLWSVLSLSQRYGGYGIPDLELNRRIRPSKRARRIARRETLVPDVSHREIRLVIEYDSNSEHLTPSQIARDASKRMALEADGYKVISVTTRQLADAREMRNVADQTSGHLGRRLQIKAKRFQDSHRVLYATGWSLGRYHRRLWLEGGRASDEM